ncbi:hypothetical protein CFO_g4806 [Ceratocystis platani]|uniref:Uncharacterized protein n=1 Tax=Ceratocystis fimbriata f. sp. platani TaxID=88771 RepID=A0A0F8BKH6_CERFI|nr:hypothetical protein CFO_g4806 [Ceratocystis platani]
MEFDEFDDDELDDLTDGALLELEQQAIQATQAQAVGSTQQPQSHAAAQSHAYSTKSAAPYAPYNYNALAPGSRHLPPQRNPAVSAMPMRPPPGGSVRPQLPPKQQQSVSGPPYPSQQTKSIQLSQQSQQPYQSRPAALHASQAYAPNSTLPLNVAEVDTSDALELQRRISLLTQQLNSAKGETAIVRSKLERTSKDHEVSLAAVRQRHDAQISTFKQTLEAAQTAEKIAKTELKFLQQELRDSDSRNRHGFDDIDLAPSPGKRASRSVSGILPSGLERTPTKNKRKRNVLDSPVPQLDMEDHGDCGVVLGLSPRHWTLPGEIVLMLDILATSGLNESIGPISADMEPSKVAAVVFERITKLLTLDAQALTPGPTPHNHQPHNHVQQDNETEAQPAQLRAVHMAALRTLLAFSQSDFGIRSLAADPHVTRRVAIILTTAVEALYCVSGRTPCTIYSDADLRLDPSTGQGSVGSGSPALGFGAHELDETATVIDLAMSILYRLVTYGSSSTLLQGEASEAQSTRKAASSLAFDLRVKLSSHGYEELEQLIVALSRLNFADEELFYEARIDPETGDKAMRVLDFLVSPQEGSDIAALFYTQAEAEAEAEDGDEAETEAQAQAQGGGKDDGMKTGDKRVGPSTAANPGVAEVISIDDD